ncbi:MAG: hypothetical protein JOS17DRAFT_761586 [Linnemannia elongata]|nr:MAG: hypothetical protein JOS17DRAFT_761586 [Linnemannia elongata]
MRKTGYLLLLSLSLCACPHQTIEIGNPASKAHLDELCGSSFLLSFFIHFWFDTMHQYVFGWSLSLSILLFFSSISILLLLSRLITADPLFSLSEG